MGNSGGTLELNSITSNNETKSEKNKFSNGPIIKQKLTFSKDGKYFIVTTEEKFIYPFNYLSKMIQNSFPDSKG